MKSNNVSEAAPNVNWELLFANKWPIVTKVLVKKRSTLWWDITVQEDFLDEDWLENFRVRKSTFHMICLHLQPYLRSSPNPIRNPMSVEKNVCYCFIILGSCREYRVVANQFGSNKCVVHKCVYFVVLAII